MGLLYSYNYRIVVLLVVAFLCRRHESFPSDWFLLKREGWGCKTKSPACWRPLLLLHNRPTGKEKLSLKQKRRQNLSIRARGCRSMQKEDDTEVTFDAVDYFESQYAEGLKVVKITCTSQLNELIEPSVISDFLMEIGACSVSVEDAKGKAQVTQPQPTPPLHKGARPTRPTAEDFPSYDCRTEEKADQEEEKDPLDYSWDDVMGATAWSSPTLTAHFPDLFDDQMLKQMIQSTFGLKDEPEVSCLTQEELQSTDWIEQSKEAWEPIQVGRIKVSFYNGEEAEEKKCSITVGQQHQEMCELKLMGGAGFGTGAHPTTNMCLRWLQEDPTRETLSKQGSRVLDYGSGSGILGLSALKLGATKADAVEIDVEAISASYQNAALNNLEIDVYSPDDASEDEGVHVFQMQHDSLVPAAGLQSSVGDLRKAGHSKSLFDLGAYDVILANVLPNLLLEMTHDFNRLLAPGGLLALSGITKSQANAVLECYKAQGFGDVKVAHIEDGYVLITAAAAAGQQKRE